jgi:serine/threonine-protein kinase
MVAEDQFQAGDIIAERYRLERLLGSGGMGLVYAALHVELERRVAIKVLRSENRGSGEALARFTLEARATARLNGPHVAKILDVGRLAPGIPYLVMEYLDGLNLQQLLERQHAFAVSQAVDYVLEACEALAEAHRAGIVHRDLKPANLFLTRDPYGDPLIKVLDFGISKFLEPADNLPVGLTDSRTLIGSPVYMSPEQMVSARNVDHRTDIWSLGAVMFELLTGHTLWTGTSLSEVCAQVTRDPTPHLIDSQPGLSPELSRVVDRCLEKDPQRRFQQVADLALALAPFGTSHGQATLQRVLRVSGYAGPIESCRATTADTPRRERVSSTLEGASATSSRRNRRLAALPLFSALLLAAVAWVIHWSMRDRGLDTSSAGSVTASAPLTQVPLGPIPRTPVPSLAPQALAIAPALATSTYAVPHPPDLRHSLVPARVPAAPKATLSPPQPSAPKPSSFDSTALDPMSIRK